MSASGLLGVYGGTFNPVHVGHLLLAEEVRERLGLARVVFVPSNLPPHKGEVLPSGAERLALVRQAIRGNPFFGAIDLEVRRGGRSYTIDTLRAIARSGFAADELVFLIGMDAFEEIGTWHAADDLAGAANFAVFPRAGHPLRDPRRHAPAAWGLTRTRERHADGLQLWRTSVGTRVWLVPTEQLSISASAIRARIARGASIRYLVPPPVERAILRGGLYRQRATTRRVAGPRHTKGV
jgi:nicotinate-nucleotide adenylyltransferase